MCSIEESERLSAKSSSRECFVTLPLMNHSHSWSFKYLLLLGLLLRPPYHRSDMSCLGWSLHWQDTWYTIREIRSQLLMPSSTSSQYKLFYILGETLSCIWYIFQMIIGNQRKHGLLTWELQVAQWSVPSNPCSQVVSYECQAHTQCR